MGRGMKNGLQLGEPAGVGGPSAVVKQEGSAVVMNILIQLGEVLGSTKGSVSLSRPNS